jgi:hypothetical protein
MNDWRNGARLRRHNVITIPVIWLAFVLSVVVHIGALWHWLPRLPRLETVAATSNDERTPLRARLASAVSRPESRLATDAGEIPVAPAPQARPRPPRRKAAPPAVGPPPPPPVQEPVSPLAAPAQKPSEPVPAASVAPSPWQAPPAADLSSYIAAQRRARGEVESPPGSRGGALVDPAAEEIARRDRIVASNLASVNNRDAGTGPRNSGGVFQITRMNYLDAEFTFFGWNNDIGRRASQHIEVRADGESDIRHALVRRMITIIRAYETEDFVWDSHRLGRRITLSARLRDNAELEAFMLREFFDATGVRQ